jgi:hypothetical protein
MEKDNYKTDVVFRVVTIQGITDVTAFFPHDVEDAKGHVGCYAHVGQHSSANYQYCVSKSRLATEEEYKDLKEELEKGFGYDLNIIRKQNYSKFLKSYNEVRYGFIGV